MIYAREAVRQAVARALLQDPGNTDAAIEHAAQALGLPVEAVREVLQAQGGDA